MNFICFLATFIYINHNILGMSNKYIKVSDYINSKKAARNYFRKNGHPDIDCSNIITFQNDLDYGLYATTINNDCDLGYENKMKWYCLQGTILYHVIQRYSATPSFPHDEAGYTYSFITPEVQKNNSIPYYRNVEVKELILSQKSIDYYKLNPLRTEYWEGNLNPPID